MNGRNVDPHARCTPASSERPITIGAKGGTGKSVLALDLIDHLSASRPPRMETVMQPRRAAPGGSPRKAGTRQRPVGP